MRIREISKAIILSASFSLVGCIAESNSEMLEEDEITTEAKDSPDTTLAESSSSEPPRPSDNMSYGNLFQGGEAVFNVHTGLEEDETAGKWYIVNDNDIGGQSNTYFPVPLKQPNNFDENISYCGGFCDTIKIVGNISTPYAGVGVNLVNKDKKGADITDWGGIIIDYISTNHPLIIALVPEGVSDFRQFYHYDLPAVHSQRAIRWSDFAQVDERVHKRNKNEDLKHIAALQFIVGGINGDETFVKINSLGTYYLRKGEVPHKFEPASSSFYFEPASNATSSAADSNSITSAASSGIADNIASGTSSNISAQSSSTADTSAVYSSSANINQISSSATAFEGQSSSNATPWSQPSSSTNQYSSSSSEASTASSSSTTTSSANSSNTTPWFDFGGGGGGWGGF